MNPTVTLIAALQALADGRRELAAQLLREVADIIGAVPGVDLPSVDTHHHRNKVVASVWRHA